MIDLREIVFGVAEQGLAHSDLDVPGKRLDFAIAGPPDVEDISAVAGEISADAGARNHMSHSECTNAVQWALCILLERNGRTFADLLYTDQRYPGKYFDVLRL